VGPRTGLHDVDRRIILAPTGTRTLTPRPSSPQPVAIPTEQVLIKNVIASEVGYVVWNSQMFEECIENTFHFVQRTTES
jgi:hypothetical protein